MSFANDNKQFMDALLEAEPEEIEVFLDYDDCLDITTRRNLTNERIQILRDLNDLTCGGIIITTNSDGRTVEKILPNFPIISEFATVFRHIDSDYPLQYRHTPPDCKNAFTRAVELAHAKSIKTTHDANELSGDEPIFKIEEKEMGIALVFGKHASLKSDAIEIAKTVFEECGFYPDSFEIDTAGKDAVEIKVKGAKKVDVLKHIQRYENLAQRKFKIFMGDSGSDWDGMKETGMGIVVGKAISEEKMNGINHIRLSSDNNNFDETWNFLKQLRDAYAAKTMQVPQAHRAPAVS